MPVQWEYRVSVIDDEWADVDQNMKDWAEAGWELVSGSTSSFTTTQAGYPTIWHTKFTMFWRRALR